MSTWHPYSVLFFARNTIQIQREKHTQTQRFLDKEKLIKYGVFVEIPQ